MYGFILPISNFSSREELNFDIVCLFLVIQIPKT